MHVSVLVQSHETRERLLDGVRATARPYAQLAFSAKPPKPITSRLPLSDSPKLLFQFVTSLYRWCMHSIPILHADSKKTDSPIERV